MAILHVRALTGPSSIPCDAVVLTESVNSRLVGNSYLTGLRKVCPSSARDAEKRRLLHVILLDS